MSDLSLISEIAPIAVGAGAEFLVDKYRPDLVNKTILNQVIFRLVPVALAATSGYVAAGTEGAIKCGGGALALEAYFVLRDSIIGLANRVHEAIDPTPNKRLL